MHVRINDKCMIILSWKLDFLYIKNIHVRNASGPGSIPRRNKCQTNPVPLLDPKPRSERSNPCLSAKNNIKYIFHIHPNPKHTAVQGVKRVFNPVMKGGVGCIHAKNKLAGRIVPFSA